MKKFSFRQVHKFGGSSIHNIQSYKRVANIIKEYSQIDDFIVLSASGNTTNYLINWFKAIKNNSVFANTMQEKIFFYQKELIYGLLSNKSANILLLKLTTDLKYLNKLLISKKFNHDIYNEVVGYGEIWSAILMSYFLKELNIPSYYLDSRLFLCADNKDGIYPTINFDLSKKLLNKIIKNVSNKILIVSGFIARNNQGKTILLGRNGSDYSATQIASLVKNVSRVTIWSDINGIYSADPFLVKNALLWRNLNLFKAQELARLSHNILHPRCLEPIFLSNYFNLYIRCSLNPKKDYTKINRVMNQDDQAKIIVNNNYVSLIEIFIEKNNNLYKLNKKILILLKSKKFNPLAAYIHKKRKIIQLCYSTESLFIVSSFLRKKLFFHGKIFFKKKISLIALIGKDKKSRYFFYKILKNKPVEFICEKFISLIAILNTNRTIKIVSELHKNIF
ncbi:MAG: hypothetical protein RA161_00285 [Arsenophonus sp.]|nr:MAG: hypothetical protein RA161_00285 [Arsenophonus sp.]